MLVRRCCNAVLQLEKFEGPAEISVTFTDNNGIKELNKQYLTAHSVLHLLGYDHMENLEKVRMREKEELIMEQLGLSASSSYIIDEDKV